MRTWLALGAATAVVAAGVVVLHQHSGSGPAPDADPAGSTGPSTDPSTDPPSTRPLVSPEGLCQAPAVVAFRVRWPDVPALASARIAAVAWVESGRIRMVSARDPRREWAVVSPLRGSRPLKVLALERIGDAWYVTRTFACADHRPAASTAPCTSRLEFGNRPYAPAPAPVERTQVGVGRALRDQGSVTGCFRTGGGDVAVLRAPAWPVTVYREQEVPPERAVVFSLEGRGATTYVAVSGAAGGGARGAGAGPAGAPPRR